MATASGDRLFAAGPPPKELGLTVGLSLLLHGMLVALVLFMPRLHLGTTISVPVSYTVNLVSPVPSGGGGGGASKAPSPPPAAPRAPAPPAPVAPPRTAPPPPAAKATEELTLPSKRAMKKAPTQVEPSLRPPSVTPRETVRPAAPAPRSPAPAPVAPAATGPAVASGSAGQATASTTTGTGNGGSGGGIEIAGDLKGPGGGSALGYYLGLLDSKISANWVPMGGGGQVAVVRFEVRPSGQVLKVTLEESSGDPGVDNAAVRAVRNSAPFPPFPNFLTESSLDLRYRFVMERG